MTQHSWDILGATFFMVVPLIALWAITTSSKRAAARIATIQKAKAAAGLWLADTAGRASDFFSNLKPRLR